VRHGGIFNGLSALGTQGVGEWTPPEMPCTVNSCANSVNDVRSYEFVKYLQGTLKANGFPNLNVDGMWGGCTKSAFEKASGQSVSKSAFESYLPIKCSKFSQYNSGCNYKSTCSSGADTYVPPVVPEYTQPIPEQVVPTVEPVKPTTTRFKMPGMTNIAATISKLVSPTALFGKPPPALPTVTGAQPLSPSQPSKPASQPYKPANVAVFFQNTGMVKSGLIPGVTNKQLMIGLVALAALTGVIVVATKKKKGPAAAGKE